jgi:hypothetical protein
MTALRIARILPTHDNAHEQYHDETGIENGHSSHVHLG